MKNLQALLMQGKVKLRINDTSDENLVIKPEEDRSKARLIAIFPNLPLDYQAEKRVIRNAKKWQPAILSGGAATRNELLAVAAMGARGLHIGSHGAKGIISLSRRQLIDADFMGRLIRLSNVELIFFMACESSSLASFCLMVGVKVVVSFNEKLADHCAGPLAERFYYELSKGKSVGESAAKASEFVRGVTKDMLIVSGDVEWRWS